jgi:hypothetical protein
VRLESPGAHAQTGGVKTCLDSAGTAKLADSRNVFRVSKSRERDRWKQGGSGVEGRKKLLKNARALGRPGRLRNPARGLKRANPWSAGILARTGESPVSGPIRQPNRTDWNTPARSVRLGKRCSDAFDAGRVPRIPTWGRRRPRRPNTLHCEEYPVAPVGRGSSVGGLTRMQLGKPCRRGRRRSQGCPRTMTLPALANFRSPARSVSRTEPTGTRLHSRSVLGSAEVTR